MKYTKALFAAIEKNDIDAVRRLIQKGVLLTDTEDDVTPLYLAVSNGQQQIVRLLSEAGVDINQQAGKNYTALQCAAVYGNLEMVRLLLERGADPNLRCGTALEAPLHKAAEEGYLSIVQCLLEHGADINIKSADNKTPLFASIRNYHLDVANYLINEGANLKVKTKRGYTVLHEAARCGCLELAQIFVEHGVDLKAKTKNNTTVLCQAARSGNFELVKFLSAGKGADFSAKNNDGETLLHAAAGSGNVESIAFFLKKGGSVKAKTQSGDTPLHYAVRSGNIDAVRLLLDKGADVNAKNKLDETPLFQLASLDGNPEIAQLLLSRGADKNIPCKSGDTPLAATLKHQLYDMARLLDPTVQIPEESNPKPTTETKSDTGSHAFDPSDFAKSVKDAMVNKANTVEKHDIFNVADADAKQTADAEIAALAAADKGDVVRFGMYPQDSDGAIQPIDWVVLNKWESRALLLSKYSIDAKPYHRGEYPVTWDRCILRKWLNTTFYAKAFTPEEQKYIYETDLPGGKNPVFNTNPGPATRDKIFVLSLSEVDRFLPKQAWRKCIPTAYTKAQAVYVDDITCSVRWCLRSPGRNTRLVAFGSITGELDYPGGFTGNIAYAIRPAMWIKF